MNLLTAKTYDELDWTGKRELFVSFWRTYDAPEAAQAADHFERANEAELNALIRQINPKLLAWIIERAPLVLELQRKIVASAGQA